MGMFDYVDHEAPCRKCGAILRDFQTKNLSCELRKVKPEDIEHGVFYTNCDNCGAWNEYTVRRSGPVVVELTKRSFEESEI
jgi:hypothetical protein